MIGNALLITVFSVNASSLVCWKVSSAVSDKRDFQLDTRGLPFITLDPYSNQSVGEVII